MRTGVGELVEVAATLGEDYFRLRTAVIRQEVRGERRNGRWFCEWESAQRWKDARQTPAAAPA